MVWSKDMIVHLLLSVRRLLKCKNQRPCACMYVCGTVDYYGQTKNWPMTYLFGFSKKILQFFWQIDTDSDKKAYNFYTNLKIALFVSKLAGCAKYVRSSKAEECVTGWCNRRSSSSLGLLCVARASDETNCQPKICAKILLISGKFLNIYLSISVSITRYLVWDEKKSVSPFVITFWLFMD